MQKDVKGYITKLKKKSKKIPEKSVNTGKFQNRLKGILDNDEQE